MANILFSILSTFNDKGLKKASKQVSLFEKQTKSLQATFLKTFSALALINYSKKAVAAFAADEAAAKSLEIQLKNTGYAFSAPGVENYIAGLQNLYGVLDDQLRPAFQQLLTATGSITRSQDALETALNISAATGKSLTEVSAALTRGFSGNTAGLSRLGAGISKATLKSGDMNKIMEELNAKFAGQAAARLDTYAGKMSLLQVSTANAAEIIGKGLVDALSLLGKDTNIADTTKKIEGLATAIADLILGIGVLGSKLTAIGDNTGLNKIISFLYQGTPLDLLIGAGRNSRETTNSKFNTVARPSVAEIATSLKLLKSKKDELAILNKKNAIENKNVEELKKKFDLERIGLMSALNQATDEETKLKLKAQLAILDNNDAMAKKILAEMEAAEALKKLAEQAAAAGKSITEFALIQVRSLINRINAQIELINAQFGLPSSTAAAGSSPARAALPASYFQDLAVGLAGSSSYAGMNVSQIATERARESGNRSVDVNLRIDSPSGDRFAQLMAESIQIANRSGYSTAPNGGLP
jgi:hypothetical protein